MRPEDAFTPDELRRVESAAPPRCGRCQVCRICVDTRYQVAEYLVNLEDWELPSIAGVIAWLRDVYPACA